MFGMGNIYMDSFQEEFLGLDDRANAVEVSMQQTKATNLIPKTPININFISEELGLPDRVDENMSIDELDKILGTSDSMQSVLS